MRKILMGSALILAVVIGQDLYKAGGSVRLVPRLLNYQGYLTDTLGNPITNPSLSMTFTIYDAVSAGNSKWAETQPSVSVSKGIFHVLLGTVTAIPDSVFNASASRWLELVVAGQIMAPRTRITSAPYAYTATYADTAIYARTGAADNDWTISGSDMYSGVAGNVGVGTATPRYKVDINGILCAGVSNTVASDYGAVLGGTNNTAGEDGDNSVLVAGGSGNHAMHSFSSIVGGRDNYSEYYYTSIGGGYRNYATAEGATIAGGEFDTVLGLYGGVLSGYNNKAGDAITDTSAVVGGGYNNNALGNHSTIAGGRFNSALGAGSTVAGGSRNSASDYGAVGGGGSNYAGGYATVPGGYGDTVSAGFSMAGGWRVRIASTAVRSFAFGSDFVVDSPSVAVFHNAAKPYKVGIGKTNPAANLDVNGSLRVTDGAFYGNIGINNGAPFPRPAYQSAWVHIPSTGGIFDSLRFVHNLGGNINDYVIDLQMKDNNEYKIHNRGIGGDYNDPQHIGAFYGNLSTTSLTVYKTFAAQLVDSVRVRIWVIK